MPNMHPAFALEAIAQRILELRGQRVMLDADLAVLYGLPTKSLLQAVKRNPAKFEDFVFQLSSEEWTSLKSQNVTSNLKSTLGISNGRGGRRYAPYAFTEHGALMLASVLNSTRAVEISRIIIRAFVWLRQSIPAYRELADKVAELEETVGRHDKDIGIVLDALRQLMAPPDKPQRKIGY